MKEIMRPNGVILAVDDEAINLRLLEGALTDQGYEVVKAGDGAQAWEILEREPERFDAVLLDRMMPNMDGMEVLARVRAHPQMRFLPVILQTAAATNQSIAEGVRAGAYHYLTKPFSPRELVLRAQAVLRRTREQPPATGIFPVSASNRESPTVRMICSACLRERWSSIRIAG